MPREHSVKDCQDDDDYEDTLWRKQASFLVPLESQRSKDGGVFQACFKHLHKPRVEEGTGEAPFQLFIVS